MTTYDEKMAKVTIIIPVYNSVNTIRRCLDGVVNQTYDNIEILIVDDGSTDNTLDIVRSFGDSRIHIVEQEHSGVSTARNTGIKKSSGKYIMFLDSDDSLEKNAIETLVECAKNRKDTIVRFGYSEINKNKKKDGKIQQFSNKTLDTSNDKDYNTLIKYFFGGGDFSIPCYSVTLFLEREFIIKENLFFNDDLCMMEDMVFYLKLFRSGKKIYFLDKPFYLCYINNNSATHSRENALNMLDGAIKSSTIILEDLDYNTDVADNCFNIIFRYIVRSMRGGHKINKELNDSRFRKIVYATSVRPKMDFFNSIYFRLARISILKRRYRLLRLLAYIYYIYNIIRGRYV